MGFEVQVGPYQYRSDRPLLVEFRMWYLDDMKTPDEKHMQRLFGCVMRSLDSAGAGYVSPFVTIFHHFTADIRTFHSI